LPSNERYELIRGELCALPDNSAEHGNKTMRLSAPVALFVEENDLGECFASETRFIIEENPDTVLAPGFAFVSHTRLNSIPAKDYLSIAPDLVIETRSPNDSRAEFALKVDRWLRAGTQVVWALDPAMRTITVHQTGVTPQTLTVEDTLSGGNVLPGFTFSLRRLFRKVVRE